MTDNSKALTGSRPIREWLAHPAGGPLLRGMLHESGQNEAALKPIEHLALEQLVELGGAQFPQSLLDQLVRDANGGAITEDAENREDTTEAGVWEERVTEGRFTGKTVIVTGAASGIGRATASRVAREGGKVIAVDIAGDRLEALAAAQPHAEVVIVQADITKDEDIARVIEAAGGRVDALANVAGIMDDMTPLHEVADEVWNRVFAVNVDGMFRLTRAVLPFMMAARHGSIVNVASEAALRGNSAGLAYTASKHAVLGITRSTAFMYAPQGIRVNAVAPGPVATGIEATFRSELGTNRLGPFMQMIPPVAAASQLAASITFLLSDDGTNISGAVLPSDGGWSVQ
ncbi:SDR family NAD(P)-dependent oxidoreductase [Arthrobacter sp. YN]|uniref:SDR family NAD(P)-dependent oxidoreductase n=1 Tax=Arthrobacter sp. YN TaxID=2020486 RepID=UPI000B5DFBB2|nr:SDR family NAD(P)-dependent oxidoreductase [Arthrobacter sp. YN]ASN20035.1 short-chain dehydrogenase [Arthrobacter sp. YN]